MRVSSLKRYQAGMSLISLMIGILISMIGILAGFLLYQNMVKVTLQTRADATQDGQLASAMLSLQLQLQSAGFGIDMAANPGPHLVLVSGPPQVLYWRYLNNPADTNSTVCAGFRVEDANVTENGVAEVRRQLQLLSPETPASCTLASNLNGLPGGWEVTSILAQFRKSEQALDITSFPVVSITEGVSQCFPYGLGQTANYRTVTISVDGAARRAAIDAGNAAPAIAPSIYSFCIPNIPNP